jgi:LmbE family N-acetylglucosaminyl deacetylase
MTMTLNTMTLNTRVADRRVADLVQPLGTIVSIWAHPDDEAYLASGLMAAAVESGQRVVCVTATRGENGTSDPTLWPPTRLARTRERELKASLAALGVTDHRWLTYEDGRCASASTDEAVATIAAILTDVGAHTVVTFGADGMTGHPDHVSVGHWATRAARHAGVDRVLHATKSETWAARFAAANESYEVFGPTGPPRTADREVALVLEPSPALADRKMASLRAHATQTTGLISAVGDDFYRSWWSTEYFVEA